MSAKLTLALGIALVLLGLGGYLISGAASVTALIPAVFGVVFIALGAVAARAPAGPSKARTIALGIAAALAVLALLGTARALPHFPAAIRGDELERPAMAYIVQTITALLSAVYLIALAAITVKARRPAPSAD